MAGYSLSRRHLMRTAFAGTALSALTPGASTAALLPTPPQTCGPFYPRTLPLDTDNDLVQISGSGNVARGAVTHIGGRVLTPQGRPIAAARLEIWQCDANGHYHHVGVGGAGLDEAFQGYGRTFSDEDGVYRFRTIRPVPYPGRTPHIHFTVSGDGFDPLVTQMYVAGEPLNDGDFLLNRLDPAARARLIVPLRPAPDLEADALAGIFDIVLQG